MGVLHRLNRVQHVVDAGLPMSAAIVAESLGVQFRPSTLAKWRRGGGPRATYVWVLEYRASALASSGTTA